MKPHQDQTKQNITSTEEVIYLSPADERANVITHSLGIALSIAATGVFYRLTANHSPGLQLACLVFTVSMATVYLFSTLSHAVQEPATRNRLRAWDQGTIYLLIVGTYSPFIWQGTSGTGRFVLFVAVWATAFFGFYSKVFAAHRVNAVSTLNYLALGWLPSVPLIQTTPIICFVWMLLGGLCYSIGVFFLKMSNRVRYSHVVWHVMVMLGSASHCYAVFKLIESLH